MAFETGRNSNANVTPMTYPGDTRWLNESQQRSWRAFLLGNTLLMDRLDDDLRRNHDISLTEYEILVRLSEREGRCMRMAHLADALAHSRSRVTHTIDRMERAGYVARRASPDDGRGVVAAMTDKGWELLQAAAHVHVQGVRSNLIDLVSDEEFEIAGRVMNAVADHLIGRHPAMEFRAQE